MLSRFSVFFVYLVASLAISAAATPMGQSGGHGDDMKQPSRHNSEQEHPYSPKYYSARDAKGHDKRPKDGEYERSKDDSGKGHCNVGKQQCCNSVNQASEISSLLALAGVNTVLSSIGLVGQNCNGLTGNACTAQPVCCEKTTFNGAFAFGCMNININK
ncbi:hypothetical protein BJY52DRAFT_511877 [Lactarius psammicola]|nr:hypothetical protein BJY52DRAFT_511877 [Lactarius psammicola]